MLNLKEVYGRRYRVVVDPSWNEETSANRTLFRQRGEEIWYFELVGRCGSLYNHDPQRLQMRINRRIGLRLASQLPPGWSVLQSASDAVTVVLPETDIGVAFRWIKPRKRRVGNTSPENIARLRVHAFPKKHQNLATQNG